MNRPRLPTHRRLMAVLALWASMSGVARAEPGHVVERELMAYARVARKERIAAGVVATVLGAGFLAAGVWYGLEEEDSGVAFISGMGLGIFGSLTIGAGIGLLTNTSTAEDVAEEVRAWRRAGAEGDSSGTRGLELEPPSLSVGPGGMFLTVGGRF